MDIFYLISSVNLIRPVIIIGFFLALLIFFSKRHKENWLLILYFGIYTSHIFGEKLAQAAFFDEAQYLYGVAQVFAMVFTPFLGYNIIELIVKGEYSKKLFKYALIFSSIYSILYVPYVIYTMNHQLEMIWGMTMWDFYLDYFKWIEVILYTLLTIISASLYYKLNSLHKNTLTLICFWLSVFIILNRIALLITYPPIRNNLQHILDVSQLIEIIAFVAFIIYYTKREIKRKFTLRSDWLDEKKEKIIIAKLKKFIDNKDYLSKGISSRFISNNLGEPARLISIVINEQYGKDISNFINELKIDEAKKIMIENPNWKLEAISDEVGYNNRTTFSKAFKQHTGLSPSEWLKNRDENSDK